MVGYSLNLSIRLFAYIFMYDLGCLDLIFFAEDHF